MMPLVELQIYKILYFTSRTKCKNYWFKSSFVNVLPVHGVAPPYPRFFCALNRLCLWVRRFAGASPHTPSLTCDAARAGGRGVAPFTCPFGRVWGRFQTVKGVFIKAAPLQTFPLDGFTAPLCPSTLYWASRHFNYFICFLVHGCVKRLLCFQAGIGIA